VSYKANKVKQENKLALTTSTLNADLLAKLSAEHELCIQSVFTKIFYCSFFVLVESTFERKTE
jgi:hypothetical protein